MNIFKKIYDKVKGWFVKQEASVEKVFKRIEPLMPQAESIVTKLDAVVTAEVKALGNSAVLTKVKTVLDEIVNVETIVTSFVTTNQNAPINSILFNAATLALQFVSGPASVIISDANLAIQTAYSVLKG